MKPTLLPLIVALVAMLLAGCAGVSLPRLTAPTATPLPAPTSTPTATPLRLTNTASLGNGDLRLSYPAGWLSRTISNTLILAGDPDLFTATNPGAELLVQVDLSYLPQLESWYGMETASNVDRLFDLSKSQSEQAGYILGSTRPISVNTASGVYADMRADGAAARLIVVRKPPYVVRVLAQSAAAAWEAHLPTLQAIIDSIGFSEPLPTATPTLAPVVEQPPLLREGPQDFVLRIGGTGSGSNASRFVSARGVAVAPNNTLYLAESSQGIWVFAPDGTLRTAFGNSELLDAFDVAVNSTGTLYVADYGSNTIVQFAPDGTLLQRWGDTTEANAPEPLFGPLAPQRLAVGRDDTVYALDSRTTDTGTSHSVLRFSPDGELIQRIPLPPAINPVDLAIDPVGNIYLADTSANGVIKVSASGQIIDRLGEQISENGIVAAALDVDRQGNLYVATWGNGLLKLTADDLLLATAGTASSTGTSPGAGVFSLPGSIAAAAGDVVWVSDNDGEYSAVTAMKLFTSAELQATADAQATVVAVAEIAPGTPVPNLSLTRQWASDATASSAYEGYPAKNATGAPDAPGCGDSQQAWASADPNGLETLEVQFRRPVLALGLHIHQNLNPGFISKVEVIDGDGSATVVYTAEPELRDPCPYVLELEFEQTDKPVDTFRITVDQRSGANWSEIDAVELLGLE